MTIIHISEKNKSSLLPERIMPMEKVYWQAIFGKIAELYILLEKRIIELSFSDKIITDKEVT
jgi:hypothetical protein